MAASSSPVCSHLLFLLLTFRAPPTHPITLPSTRSNCGKRSQQSWRSKPWPYPRPAAFRQFGQISGDRQYRHANRERHLGWGGGRKTGICAFRKSTMGTQVVSWSQSTISPSLVWPFILSEKFIWVGGEGHCSHLEHLGWKAWLSFLELQSIGLRSRCKRDCTLEAGM